MRTGSVAIIAVPAATTARPAATVRRLPYRSTSPGDSGAATIMNSAMGAMWRADENVP